jgi:nicotinamide riboside transporter PnuC
MWSWILACVGVIGTFFVGRKTIWGWVVLFINECLWLIYATQTKQYGFYLGSIAYMSVYIKSYIHWSKEEKDIVYGDMQLANAKRTQK